MLRLQGWLGGVVGEDEDTTCKSMARACLQLHDALTIEALAAGAALPTSSAWPGSAGGAAGVLLQGPLGLVRQGVVMPGAWKGGNQMLVPGLDMLSV